MLGAVLSPPGSPSPAPRAPADVTATPDPRRPPLPACPAAPKRGSRSAARTERQRRLRERGSRESWRRPRPLTPQRPLTPRPRPRPPPVRSGLIRFNPVMAAPRLLLALAPLACALLTSEPPAPPFRNLRLEPSLLRLSWDGYITSGSREVVCQKGAESPVRAPARSSFCRFSSLSLCHVTEFSVSRAGDPGSTARIRFPVSDPDRASAATDLRCWVHDVDSMTCRWGRGLAAPEGAQYRMFWRDAGLGRDRDRECTHYNLADPWGSRLGCRVDSIAALPGHVTVTVTGGGGASCSDISLDLQRAEVLTPPALSAACNGTEAAQLHWEMRSHFHRRFQYELQINKSSHLEPEIEETSENHFWVVTPGSASFRVRAKPKSSPRFSEWSRAVRLDCDPAAGTRNRRVTVMAAALAALGVGLAALATLLLCRRPLRAKLFPPIPRVKDLGRGEEAEVVWTAAPEDPEVTPVMEA